MRRQLLAAVLAVLVFAPAGEAWTWPATGTVLQPFAFDPAHPYAAGQHRGLDVGGEPGAAVLAPAVGAVTFAGTVPSSGKSVTITTADGYAVTLTHLETIAVARGASVEEGAVVGTIGPSGDPEVAQPYVHLGIRVAAEPQGYLDPVAFLPTRAAAPAALVPPVVVDSAPTPPPLAEPAPAPVGQPVAPVAPVAAAKPALAPVSAPAPDPRAALPVGDATPAARASEPVAGRAPVAEPAPPPVAVATPVEPSAAPDSAPIAGESPPLPADEPTSLHLTSTSVNAKGGQPVRGAAALPVLQEVAPRDSAAATADEPRRGSWVETPARGQRAFAGSAVPGLAAAGAWSGTHPRVAARPHAHGRVRATTGAQVLAGVPRLEPRRTGAAIPVLAVGALLAAVLLTGALGAVRMMVRCGTDTEEDPGRSGLAVCGGSPSPRSRGGLRRPVGRIRSLPPAEGQRRPYGERHGRARHPGDGGRRQGGQVLR